MENTKVLNTQSKPFRCGWGRHGASMDFDTFEYIILGMKDKGLSNAVVSHYNSIYGYGFNYTIDDSTYSAHFIQLQPTWGEAAVVCLQTIVQHLKQIGRIKKPN